MVVISFLPEFLDPLLRGDKQQTTRKQTDKINVGDIYHICIEQTKRIIDNPLRRLTQSGYALRLNWTNNDGTYHPNHDYAHFLGKVKITEVYNIHPCEMAGEELEAWARADGFPCFASARCWFEIRYGARWMHKTWTVIGWDGWTDRQFEPGEQ